MKKINIVWLSADDIQKKSSFTRDTINEKIRKIREIMIEDGWATPSHKISKEYYDKYFHKKNLGWKKKREKTAINK